MKEVIFASARSKEFSYQTSMVAKLERMLRKVDLSRYIAKDDYVAIKTHFGSEGGHRIVRPIFLKKVVEAVKAVGGKPFVTDTVRLKGLDYLEIANMEGITPLSVGCPVILADGLFGRNCQRVSAGNILGEIGIASEIYDADAMVVVTHCKGHIQAGYGGAIKNLAMGAVSDKNREGKSERAKIHATDTQLDWDEGKCELCGDCVDICDHDALTMSEKIEINHFICHKCRRCVEVCENDALILPVMEDEFQMAMAEAAKAALDTFKKGKVIFINFVMEVMPHCDCHPHSDVPVINDQGILMCDDIVAMDLASLDMIEKSPRLPDSAAENLDAKTGLFKGLTGRDPYVHVHHAAKLGLGQKEYKLVRMD
ncbi:MAG: DUF362 domain-containing protein [Methanomassiliicoccales archaeon]|nr:MAG: DUF362 domain-containing protein [Methanomassiliicoccales archaeon]